MTSLNSYRSMAALNVTLYAFFALNPFIRWILPTELTYAFFIITTFITTSQNMLRFNRSRKIMFIVLLIFVGYITLPIFSHYSLRIGHFLWFSPLFIMVFYDDEILAEAFIKLKKIIVFFSIVTIVVWTLRSIGVELPYIWIYQSDYHFEGLKHHRLYGLVLAVYTRGTPVQSGLGGLERACGPFAEPGHFAVILGMLLLMSKYEVSHKSNRALLIAGMMTLSPAFYFMVLLGVGYRFLQREKMAISLIYTIIIIATFIFVGTTETHVGQQIQYLGYERTFGQIEINPLDDRISDAFWKTYNTHLMEGNILVGVGFDVSRGAWIPSNYRSLIYRFGLIGFSLSIFLSLIILSKVWPRKRLFFTVFVATLGVLAHRYQFLLNPQTYVLLLLGASYLMSIDENQA